MFVGRAGQRKLPEMSAKADARPTARFAGESSLWLKELNAARSS